MSTNAGTPDPTPPDIAAETGPVQEGPQADARPTVEPVAATENSPRTGGKFKPGQSGNPGGRPKVLREARELAQKHGPAVIKRLLELSQSANEQVALRACEALLDRGYGRPTETVRTDNITTHVIPQNLISFARGGPGQPPHSLEDAGAVDTSDLDKVYGIETSGLPDEDDSEGWEDTDMPLLAGPQAAPIAAVEESAPNRERPAEPATGEYLPAAKSRKAEEAVQAQQDVLKFWQRLGIK